MRSRYPSKSSLSSNWLLLKQLNCGDDSINCPRMLWLIGGASINDQIMVCAFGGIEIGIIWSTWAGELG